MTILKLDTPVIIIGAGPAGAATSIFLSKAGIQHIILDKEKFPRDKICGDACSGKTAFVLRRANPAWMEEIQAHEEKFTPSFGITFVAPNGKTLDIPFTPTRTAATKAPGFIVSRLVFDNYLFQKIPSPHATVFEAATIKSIERNNNGIQTTFSANNITYQVNAKIIVGADGDKGIVRKTFINNSTPKAYAVGLRAYYQGISSLHSDNYLELHFLPEIKPGYFWIFPLPNGMANVGAGILSQTLRKKKINLRELMLNAIKNNPALKYRFAKATLVDKIQGWGLPMATKREPVSGDNFMLTGDAASLIDPFSGEGIGNALYSGMLAAQAIQKSIEQNNTTASFFNTAYDDVVWKRLGDEFKISTTLQRLCNYPMLFNYAVNKANKSPSFKNTISCSFTDMDLRGQLRKPSFYFKILFNR